MDKNKNESNNSNISDSKILNANYELKEKNNESLNIAKDQSTDILNDQSTDIKKKKNHKRKK